VVAGPTAPGDTLTIDGVQMPRLLYGTAWKEQATAGLVTESLEQGFRGIDTANQRRHYFEAAVGEGIAEAIRRGVVDRGSLFLQTKFTPRRGQDHRLPYDPNAAIAEQVDQSLASSLEHLGGEAIDSLVLHAPTSAHGLGAADWEAWRSMESAHQQGRVRLIGISNVDLGQLQQFCDAAQVQPHVVQNRCFARTVWDRRVREFCRDRGIVYQAFSLLTANAAEVSVPAVQQISRRHDRTIPQIVFRFALESGMVALTGTTDPQHMRDDLAVFDFELDPAERETIEAVAVR